jgi:hypothetical protein
MSKSDLSYLTLDRSPDQQKIEPQTFHSAALEYDDDLEEEALATQVHGIRRASRHKKII